jgi:hypothetical protein
VSLHSAASPVPLEDKQALQAVLRSLSPHAAPAEIAEPGPMQYSELHHSHTWAPVSKRTDGMHCHEHRAAAAVGSKQYGWRRNDLTVTDTPPASSASATASTKNSTHRNAGVDSRCSQRWRPFRVDGRARRSGCFSDTYNVDP